MLVKFMRLENRINGNYFFDKSAEIIVPPLVSLTVNGILVKMKSRMKAGNFFMSKILSRFNHWYSNNINTIFG